MKFRNYEKKELVVLISIIIIIVEILLLILLYSMKEYKYEKLTGIVLKDDIVMVVASKKERKLIYAGKILYINDQKKKYKVLEDRGAIITQGNRKYHELLIEFKFDKKYKTSDVLDLSFKKEKYRLIEIFKMIWESD